MRNLCSIFKEKVVKDQVCYEAELNHLKNKLKLVAALQVGLSLIRSHFPPQVVLQYYKREIEMKRSD